MTENKRYRVVAPDRYLRVRDEPARVTVRYRGELVAESRGAVRLAEGDRADVLYLPREDIELGRLVVSSQRFRCRWKGEASYFHVDVRDRTLDNAVWAYAEAPEPLEALRDRVAFDPSVFDIGTDATAVETLESAASGGGDLVTVLVNDGA